MQLNQVILEGRVIDRPVVNESGTRVEFFIDNHRTYQHDGENHQSYDIFKVVSFDKEYQTQRLLKANDRVVIFGAINMHQSEVQIIADKIIEGKKSL